MEITDRRCYVLWTKNKRGKISHDPTVFTTAAGAITEGERQKEKGLIEDYNFSIVMCPQITGEMQTVEKQVLTSPGVRETIQL